MSASKSENTTNTPDYDTSQPRETLTRVRKKRKNPKAKRNRRIILGIIGGVILLIIVLWLIGFFAMRSQPGDPGKEVWYNGHKYVFNENVISTLLIGYDKDSVREQNNATPQADYIMLVNLDTSNNRISQISIPRDTMVKVDRYIIGNYLGEGQEMQICGSYAYGSGKEDSCEYTKNAVSRLLYNMPLNKYISLNMDGVGPLADAIDGVNLTALETIPNTPIKKDNKILLLGNNARSYVQWRAQDADASERRRQRQVQFSQEYYKQGFKKAAGNLGIIFNVYNAGLPYVVSNFGIPDVVYSSTVVFGANINHIENYSISGDKKIGDDGLVEIWPDDTQVFETVLSVFYNMVE